jgi:hypothetical protein
LSGAKGAPFSNELVPDLPVGYPMAPPWIELPESASCVIFAGATIEIRVDVGLGDRRTIRWRDYLFDPERGAECFVEK